MTFGQLRTFLEVSRHGSIRAAAASLMVTEPSVSATVTSLSHEIGVDLLQRDGRGIRLTAAGLQLAKYAAEILGLAEQASSRVREAGGKTGRLHLAAVTTAGEHVLPPVLKLFKEQQPKVQIWMEVGNRVSLFEYLYSRQADLAIGGRPPADSKIAGEPFLENRLLIVSAPDHPLAKKRALEPAQLANQTWLLRESGSGTREALEEFQKKHHIEPGGTMTLGSNGAVKHAAIAGLGITMISTHAIAAELASGTLARLRVPGTPLKREWFVNYLADTPPQGSVLEFLRLLRSPAARRAIDQWFGPAKKFVA
ncbi:MAG: LysR family transcriptional regulator [Actinomycetota bacterium]